MTASATACAAEATAAYAQKLLHHCMLAVSGLFCRDPGVLHACTGFWVLVRLLVFAVPHHVKVNGLVWLPDRQYCICYNVRQLLCQVWRQLGHQAGAADAAQQLQCHNEQKPSIHVHTTTLRSSAVQYQLQRMRTSMVQCCDEL